MSDYLTVLDPIKITRAMLTSSNATAETALAWVSGQVYAIGDFVKRTATDWVYKCAIAGATAIAPEDDPNKWEAWRPVNDWAMFDDEVATQTLAGSPFTFVMQVGYFNALFLGGIENASGLHVVVKDAPGGNVIRDVVDAMENSAPIDAYEYWYMPFSPKTNIQISGIEPYLTAEVSVTLTSTAPVIKVGIFSIGDLKPLGQPERNMEAEPVDYSYVDINKRGENVIIKGKNALDMSVSAVLKLDDANSVVATLRSVLGKACVWSVTERPEHDALRTFGLGKGRVSYPNAKECLLALKVNGVI